MRITGIGLGVGVLAATVSGPGHAGLINLDLVTYPDVFSGYLDVVFDAPSRPVHGDRIRDCLRQRTW